MPLIRYQDPEVGCTSPEAMTRAAGSAFVAIHLASGNPVGKRPVWAGFWRRCSRRPSSASV